MAEWSKAPDSRSILPVVNGVECSGPRMWAWVRIPLLAKVFSYLNEAIRCSFVMIRFNTLFQTYNIFLRILDIICGVMYLN